MKVEPFKGRGLDIDKAVDVYRCLNRKGFIFSLRQDGKVVGHTDDITLINVEFKVNESGHRRYLREKHRNVHAFARGFVTSNEQITPTKPLTYDLPEGRFKVDTIAIETATKLQIKDKQIKVRVI